MTEVNLGWGRKPLREQLAGSVLDAGAIEHADLDADAVCRLHIRGLITDKMRDHAMKNLMRRLEKSPRQAPAPTGENQLGCGSQERT